MRTTKNYEAPAVELIEALNEGFIAASPGTDPYPTGDGFLLPDLQEGHSF